VEKGWFLRRLCLSKGEIFDVHALELGRGDDGARGMTALILDFLRSSEKSAFPTRGVAKGCEKML